MGNIAGFVLLIILIWVVANLLVCIRYFGVLGRLWCEPVFRDPVVVFESDDWGAGPLQQVEALVAVKNLLEQFKDRFQRSPVMTIGVALSVPDGRKIADTGVSGAYYRCTLAKDKYRGIVQVLKQGESGGVFVLQLHGMEHFWPPSVMERAQRVPEVQQWLIGQEHLTEQLPSELQSRWIDAATLPSSDHKSAAVGAAVAEEVAEYEKVFGNRPSVVVPPTFVWNEVVEQAWHDQGIRYLVTPGKRFIARDAKNKLVDDSHEIFAGEQGASGIRYVRRDDYFEPSLGHCYTRGLDAIACKTACGRPTLFETHRMNFLGEAKENSLAELARLLESIIEAYPSVRFLTTEEIGRCYDNPDADLVEHKLGVRFRCWLNRLRQHTGIWRALGFSGGRLLVSTLLWLGRVGHGRASIAGV